MPHGSRVPSQVRCRRQERDASEDGIAAAIDENTPVMEDHAEFFPSISPCLPRSLDFGLLLYIAASFLEILDPFLYRPGERG